MKTFTEKEVDKFIRATINETASGIFEWIENETNIVNIETREVLDDTTEIDIKSTNVSLMTEYIYPRLKKHGININIVD